MQLRKPGGNTRSSPSSVGAGGAEQAVPAATGRPAERRARRPQLSAIRRQTSADMSPNMPSETEERREREQLRSIGCRTSMLYCRVVEREDCPYLVRCVCCLLARACAQQKREKKPVIKKPACADTQKETQPAEQSRRPSLNLSTYLFLRECLSVMEEGGEKVYI